jgi:hypothetical protein
LLTAEKVALRPEKSSNGFSVLEISDRLESEVQQAVICLTVTKMRPDYSRYLRTG